MHSHKLTNENDENREYGDTASATYDGDRERDDAGARTDDAAATDPEHTGYDGADDADRAGSEPLLGGLPGEHTDEGEHTTGEYPAGDGGEYGTGEHDATGEPVALGGTADEHGTTDEDGTLGEHGTDALGEHGTSDEAGNVYGTEHDAADTDLTRDDAAGAGLGGDESRTVVAGSDAGATDETSADDVAVGTAAVPAETDPVAGGATAHETAAGTTADAAAGTTADNTAGTPAATTDGGDAPLWPADRAEDFTNRWREAQVQFVDDPAAAVASGRDLVVDALRTLTDSLPAAGSAGDTERLRLEMRRYHTVLDQLTGL